MKLKNKTLKQAIKYLLVGGTCTILDFILLYFFVEWMDIDLLISSTMSFLFGVILNYILCTNWIFDIRLVNNKSIEFGLYILISLVGLGINNLVINFLSTYLGVYFMFSKGIAAFATFFWNFCGRKYLLHIKHNQINN